MKRILVASLITICTTTASAKVRFEYSKDKDPWNPRNNPHILNKAHLDKTYNYSYADLKKANSLTYMPWTDDYWPTYKGGITYRWNDISLDWYSKERFSYDILNKNALKEVDTSTLSPAEKYDIYVGQYDFPLTKHERKRTQILKTVPNHDQYVEGYEIPTWEGLCHGWAPATLLYKNPMPVKMVNSDGIEVEFGSSDIKALLTFFLHYERSPETSFLGERCNTDFSKLEEQFENGEITQEEYDRELLENGCADVNPGALHVILANELEEDRGFVIDITRDQEVWNQPVYSYESTEVSRRGPNENEYRYGAREIVEIESVVSFIVENTPEWDLNIDHRSHNRAYYHYELELDESGEIIGGKWKSFERPDFLWMQKKPQFKGFFSLLKNIYIKSIQH